MRNSLKTALFLSAFSPSLFSVALARLFTQGFCIEELYYAAVGLLGVVSGFLIMDALRRYGEAFNFSAKKIEATDAAMLAVVATYIVPFITKASDVTLLGIIGLALLLGWVLWMTSALVPHPFLRLLKYRFYKVESTDGVVYTLITTRDLLSPCDVRLVKKITNSMFVECMI